MREVLHLEFSQLAWLPHPTIQGVETRFFATGQPVMDVLLARVEVGQTIGWHVHPETCEVGYVLQGQGRLSFSETESREKTSHINLQTGTAVLVPSGIWHSLSNTGTEILMLFALHTQESNKFNDKEF